jgi:hypothetical protein
MPTLYWAPLWVGAAVLEIVFQKVGNKFIEDYPLRWSYWMKLQPFGDDIEYADCLIFY